MIPIDRQIENQRAICNGIDSKYENAKLASLEELKRIREVQVPEEPESVRYLRECVVARTRGESTLQYIDTLRDLLKRETARADDLQKLHENKYTLMTGNALAHMKQRAEAAESKLAQIAKMGREPSAGMKQHGKTAMFTGAWESEESEAAAIFTAMHNKMMEELK